MRISVPPSVQPWIYTFLDALDVHPPSCSGLVSSRLSIPLTPTPRTPSAAARTHGCVLSLLPSLPCTYCRCLSPQCHSLHPMAVVCPPVPSLVPALHPIALVCPQRPHFLPPPPPALPPCPT